MIWTSFDQATATAFKTRSSYSAMSKGRHVNVDQAAGKQFLITHVFNQVARVHHGL